MVNTLKLPVGIDSFEKIRRNGFYYIDKTNLIEQILMNWGEVTLFTRPRRFGKTLNMSMLKSFFEIGADVSLFEGLYIAKNKELCDAYMGKYPVIFLTLKGVEGLTFADAKRMLGTILANEMDRHYYLKTSDALTDEDKAYFAKMLTGTDENIEDSIRKLSQLLYKHHGKKVVIIIDEYDVPLDKAYQNGYYREMVSLIRGLFGQALKTNDYLQFAFLTGCLRVSKESIFTGLNNFKVLSIMDSRFDEQFGFTDDEVKKLLASYGLASHFPETKEWYDGYHFGNADVYCPWDVINYVDELNYDQTVEPQDYWSNSSGNAIVRRLIDKADASFGNLLFQFVCLAFKHCLVDLVFHRFFEDFLISLGFYLVAQHFKVDSQRLTCGFLVGTVVAEQFVQIIPQFPKRIFHFSCRRFRELISVEYAFFG